jgi:peptide/nickel transport system substrate-binding protein
MRASALIGLTLALLAAFDARAADTPLRVGPDRYNTDPKGFSFTMRAPNIRIGGTPVRPDPSYLPEPLLFESWSLDDGVYRATLREGAVFHDGKPLTADSFVAAMRAFIATRDFIAVDPDSIAKVDERTVSFKSSTGSALTIENMAHALAAVLSPEGEPAKDPVGTGPCRFVRYEPKSLIEIARNDAYWGPKPRNERIVYRFIDDPQARLLALVNGELDLVTDVVPQMLLALPPGDQVAVHLSRPVQYAALLVSIHGKPPYD